MALTKAELADRLSTELGISKSVAKDIVDMTFEEIRQALEQGEEVKLSGLGNFEPRDKVERPGRNPKTGEEKKILARRVVGFRAGQKLKAKIEHRQDENKLEEEVKEEDV